MVIFTIYKKINVHNGIPLYCGPSLPHLNTDSLVCRLPLTIRVKSILSGREADSAVCHVGFVTPCPLESIISYKLAEVDASV